MPRRAYAAEAAPFYVVIRQCAIGQDQGPAAIIDIIGFNQS